MGLLIMTGFNYSLIEETTAQTTSVFVFKNYKNYKNGTIIDGNSNTWLTFNMLSFQEMFLPVLYILILLSQQGVGV